MSHPSSRLPCTPITIGSDAPLEEAGFIFGQGAVSRAGPQRRRSQDLGLVSRGNGGPAPPTGQMAGHYACATLRSSNNGRDARMARGAAKTEAPFRRFPAASLRLAPAEQDTDDADSPYLLIQRQFEDPDDN